MQNSIEGAAVARQGATAPKDRHLDAVVVGAGFAGLYLIHKLRGMGLSAQAVEAGSGVGGTWFWNRYPGARCDIESMQYSYSFDEDLQQEWNWSERFASQSEILSYLNHVADRFDLRKDIQFNTRAVSAIWDEASKLWRVTMDDGSVWSGRYCIMATGCLSASRLPDIPGLSSFAGRTFHTGQWPHDRIDFSDRRVGVVGTGSSGIQAIPVIAADAGKLTVFQRTPNFSVPARNQPMTAEYAKGWKRYYPSLRKRAREQFPNGTIRHLGTKSALQADDAERKRELEAAWQRGGPDLMWAFNDLGTNLDANEIAADFVRTKIDETVEDPAVAAKLKPYDYPIGTKRICVDTDYYATFNRPNVELVDLRKEPIVTVEPAGLRTSAALYELDDLVFATGFDAMTGALARIDIRGSDGEMLRDKWHAGPKTYLGLMSAGFPNLFMITGPGSPSVLGNVVVSIEQHVELLSRLLGEAASRDATIIEANEGDEEAWCAHVNETAAATLYPRAASWYMGANIPGKPRIFMPYVGGVHVFRKICDERVEDGFRGFSFRHGDEETRRPARYAASRG